MRKIADSHIHIRFSRDEEIIKMLDDIEAQPEDPYYVKGYDLVPHLKDDPNQNIALDFCKKRLAERK